MGSMSELEVEEEMGVKERVSGLFQESLKDDGWMDGWMDGLVDWWMDG